MKKEKNEQDILCKRFIKAYNNVPPVSRKREIVYFHNEKGYTFEDLYKEVDTGSEVRRQALRLLAEMEII